MICQHRKLKSQTDVGFPVNKVEMVLFHNVIVESNVCISSES